MLPRLIGSNVPAIVFNHPSSSDWSESSAAGSRKSPRLIGFNVAAIAFNHSSSSDWSRPLSAASVERLESRGGSGAVLCSTGDP